MCYISYVIIFNISILIAVNITSDCNAMYGNQASHIEQEAACLFLIATKIKSYWKLFCKQNNLSDDIISALEGSADNDEDRASKALQFLKNDNKIPDDISRIRKIVDDFLTVTSLPPLQEEELRQIAIDISSNWCVFVQLLGLNYIQVKAIPKTPSDKPEDRAYRALVKARETLGDRFCIQNVKEKAKEFFQINKLYLPMPKPPKKISGSPQSVTPINLSGMDISQIAKKLAPHWKRFSLFCGIKEGIIKNIECDYYNEGIQEQSYQAIRTCEKTYGCNFNVNAKAEEFLSSIAGKPTEKSEIKVPVPELSLKETLDGLHLDKSGEEVVCGICMNVANLTLFCGHPFCDDCMLENEGRPTGKTCVMCAEEFDKTKIRPIIK